MRKDKRVSLLADIRRSLEVSGYDEVSRRLLSFEMTRPKFSVTLRSAPGTRVVLFSVGTDGSVMLSCSVHNDVGWVEYARRFPHVRAAVEVGLSVVDAFVCWTRAGMFRRCAAPRDHFVLGGFAVGAVDLEREFEPLMTSVLSSR